MAPIQFSTWAPRNVKPTWDWKARGSQEWKLFTVPFAIKEYLQNCTGQVLKNLGQREWSEWLREDLAEMSAEQRRDRKATLLQSYPALFAGPHGVSLKHKDTLPLYILSANVPVPSKSDLKIAVVWWITGDYIGALSFYNNHLDTSATFSSFVVDGSSTSRDDPNAVGEKGKGFILATQYLFEIIEKYMRKLGPTRLISGATKPGISFHVGEQIGELKWKKSVRDGDMLRVILDDLSPRRPTEYLKLKFQQAIDAREPDEQDQKYPENEESKKMLDAAASALNAIQKRRVAYGFIDADGTSRIVHDDDVGITIIGLDASLLPTTLFSAIYGIIPSSRSWRIPGQPIQFFLPASGPARFYHRDQYIPFGVHLDRLSVNYHGNLSISSERVVVLNDALLQKYQTILSYSADIAIQTFPDLAVEIALDVLSSSHLEGLAFLLKPLSRNHAKAYRTAFDAAFHQKYNIPDGIKIHPHPPTEERLELFGELGLRPVMVTHPAWTVIHGSGAYLPINEYARSILLASPPVADIPGLAHIRNAFSMILPALPAQNITVRQYEKQAPTVVWDKKDNIFAFALPKPCEDHPDDQCLCWVGPSLQEAAKDYKAAQINPSKLFRAYLSCMGGDASMKSINRSSTAMDVDTPPKPPTAPAAPGPQVATTSTTSAVAPGQSNRTPTITQPQPVHTSSIPTLANGAVASTSAIPIASQPQLVKVISLVKATAVRPPVDEAALDREGLERFGRRLLALADSEQRIGTLQAELNTLKTSTVAMQQELEELCTDSQTKQTRIAVLEADKADHAERLAFYQDFEDKMLERRAKRPRTEYAPSEVCMASVGTVGGSTHVQG